jgi:hypothetical protein
MGEPTQDLSLFERWRSAWWRRAFAALPNVP